MNLALFLATVLIWGSTWIAISLQVGPVPVLVSVFYRFAVAGVLFVLGLALIGRLRWPTRHQHPWIMAQALCLFSLNFLCFYTSARFIPSGLISVVFSLATIFNAVNARIFFGDRVSGRAALAGAVGVTGLVLLFGPEMSLGDPVETAKGVALAACGTLLFSLGNMVSRRNSAAGLGPVQANAWGMCHGALIVLAVIAVTGTPVVLPPDGLYLSAVLYLAVVGSIIGFTTYLMMVSRLGSARAAYATVLFPLVALAISTVFEGYTWGPVNSIGLLLALAGNVIMFSKPRAGTASPDLPLGKVT